jgi:two-component system, LytTR family, response regulator
MTWRAYVVDDEPLALDRLVRMLESTGRVSIAGASRSPRAARAFLQSHPVDVLFLDIHMPGMNGFEMLADLDPAPAVVFSTAYDEFALKAFAVNSIDYLLKPVEPDHLVRALDKLDRLRGEPSRTADLRRVAEEVVRAVQTQPPTFPERLASRLGDRICFVDVQTVTHVYADAKLTYAVVGGKPHCLDEPLAELERRLDPRWFLRIHRATLVNARWVGELRTNAGGGLVIQLNDERRTQLAVARSRVAEVKARLGT